MNVHEVMACSLYLMNKMRWNFIRIRLWTFFFGGLTRQVLDRSMSRFLIG